MEMVSGDHKMWTPSNNDVQLFITINAEHSVNRKKLDSIIKKVLPAWFLPLNMRYPVSVILTYKKWLNRTQKERAII